MIIHAVGPVWQDGRSGEQNNLFDAVFEALKMAGQKQLRSIAIPAISTGIFGYPLQAASRVILEAIMDYYQEGNQLPAEVHLVNNDARTVDVFHEALQQTFGAENTRTMATEHAEESYASGRRAWLDSEPTSEYCHLFSLVIYWHWLFWKEQL